MNNAIGAAPRAVARELALAIQDSRPTQAQISQLGLDLLDRHTRLPGLKRVVSSEEIVEAYYRCVLTHLVAKRYALNARVVPSCINSSHRAVRRVCATLSHSHAAIEDPAWHAGWAQMVKGPPRVGIREAGRRSARHADLYVVANEQIVSFEFKYLDAKGLHDVSGCAAQIALHARHYSEVALVLYSGAGQGPLHVKSRIQSLVKARNVRTISVAGPAIPIVGPDT